MKKHQPGYHLIETKVCAVCPCCCGLITVIIDQKDAEKGAYDKVQVTAGGEKPIEGATQKTQIQSKNPA
jgi:hypothetical protein